MADSATGDLLTLDRDVASAARRLARWRASLAAKPDAHAEEDPLEDFRHVAGKSLWEGLGKLPDGGGADAPLVTGLRRWVYALLQARVNREEEVAWARAATARHGVTAGEKERQSSWREAWRDVVVSKTAHEAQQSLEAAASAASGLAEVATRLAERRTEVARRLQLGHPWVPLVALSPGDVRRTAAGFLDSTDDIARFLRAENGQAGQGAAAILNSAVARGAGQGWPGRLTPRWLRETFAAETEGLDLELPGLPTAIGAASFARALATFGFALRVAVAPRSMPFSLAHEPAFVGAHRLAFVFGALAADPDFHTRILGTGRRTASMQARLLAGSALLEARLHAARILLCDEGTPASRELFEEIGARLFGLPLDSRLRGAWPRARDDEPARWIGLLEALPLREDLRQRFDVDWFRNPRAWVDIRAQGAGPARELVDESISATGPGALARAFEKVLG